MRGRSGDVVIIWRMLALSRDGTGTLTGEVRLKTVYKPVGMRLLVDWKIRDI